MAGLRFAVESTVTPKHNACRSRTASGEVAERLNAPVLKTGKGS